MLDSIFAALSGFLSGTNSVISFILFITIFAIYLFAILTISTEPQLLNKLYANIDKGAQSDEDEDIPRVIKLITYTLIIITSIVTVFFTYAKYNSGQDYFSPTVRYILSAILIAYAIAALLTFGLSYHETKDRQKTKHNTLHLLLAPAYCMTAGIALGITINLLEMIINYKYIIIGLILFIYLFILYNVKFRPDSPIASLNDNILGLILPKQTAQKHIKRYFADKEFANTAEIEDMLKRKSIKLTTQDIEEVLSKLESSGYIASNAHGAWIFTGDNNDRPQP